MSTAIASLFSSHAQQYQALSAEATVLHDQFVQHLTASAGSYASAEAANAASFGPLAAIGGAAASTIGAFQGSARNVFNAAADQLTGALTNLLDTIGYALFAILFSPILVPFLAALLYAAYAGNITLF